MSSNTDKAIIQSTGLGKRYTLGGPDQQHDTLRDMLASVMSSPFKRFKKLKHGTDKSNESANPNEKFWALKDVNFSIYPGEVVGVIGHNGAGKSTLLKVLTRITTPTEGKVTMRGRVASLLEVGTGFHPELTGRENIYLNGAILGMSRTEISSKFDEIVSFAEVEKFLDTPVKRYSSGMYVRLAFAVAAHLDVDILLVDEVLAVGDQAFQNRCLGKLGEVSKEGRTVVFVSHNLSMVSRLCSKTLLLEKGTVKTFAETNQVIAEYAASKIKQLDGKLTGFSGPLDKVVSMKSVSINDVDSPNVIISPSDKVVIKMQFVSKQQLSKVRCAASISKDGQVVISQYDTHEPELLEQGEYEVTFIFEEKLLSPGGYTISLGVSDQESGHWLWGLEVREFNITEEWFVDFQPKESMGFINYRPLAERKKL